MNANSWIVCVIEANRFEAQIVVDLLKYAGVTRVKAFTDSDTAMMELGAFQPNVIIASLEQTPVGGVEWVRAFRRNHQVLDRKAAVFLTSRAFSRAIAEECRIAGANALIGKPMTGKSLTGTIQKVLSAPRPFIDAAGYVGPCRRAGIVTAGPAKQRRKADASKAA